jgi:predicted DNA-binding transcriptional regulator AlpA
VRLNHGEVGRNRTGWTFFPWRPDLKPSPTPAADQSPRLLKKTEVCAIANATFPSIWAWMRDGKFPRARVVGGRSMWRSDEIDAWLAGLPVRRLKGDEAEAENNNTAA